MDYKELVFKSLRLVWGNKWLWVFGLFAAGGSGSFNFPGGGGGNVGSFSEGSSDFNYNWQAFNHSVSNWVSENLVLLIALGVILFLLFILAAIFGIISQAALIDGADKLDKEEETGFSKSLGVGISSFWRLFSFMILLGLIVFVPLFFLVAVIGFFVLAAGASPILFVLLVPVVLVMIPVFIALGFVAILGARSIVIDDVGPVAGIKSGWKMLRENLGPVLLTWLVSLVVGFIVGIAVVILLVMLIVPIGILGFLTITSGLSTAKLAGIGIMVLLALLVFLVIRSVLGAYNSVYWTLAFRQIRALNEPKVPE